MKVKAEKVKDLLKELVQDSPLVTDIFDSTPKTPDEIWRKMDLLIE